MGNPTPPLTAETEALKELYAALNRNDITAAVKAFDSRIEWTDPVENPEEGIYRGLAEVEAHFTRARGTWAKEVASRSGSSLPAIRSWCSLRCA